MFTTVVTTLRMGDSNFKRDPGKYERDPSQTTDILLCLQRPIVNKRNLLSRQTHSRSSNAGAQPSSCARKRVRSERGSGFAPSDTRAYVRTFCYFLGGACMTRGARARVCVLERVWCAHERVGILYARVCVCVRASSGDARLCLAMCRNGDMHVLSRARRYMPGA